VGAWRAANWTSRGVFGVDVHEMVKFQRLRHGMTTTAVSPILYDAMVVLPVAKAVQDRVKEPRQPARH
jgi:hypothetical protein